jgi:phage baseplate assembly protein W
MAWKDIDIQFRKKNDGDVRDMVGVDAINNSLTNIFSTMQGTRRMLPTFAANMQSFLFEQIDDMTAISIGNYLLNEFIDWEPRIKITNLNVKPKEDDNMYVITLTYIIINDGVSDATYTFNTILRAV